MGTTNLIADYIMNMSEFLHALFWTMLLFRNMQPFLPYIRKTGKTKRFSNLDDLLNWRKQACVTEKLVSANEMHSGKSMKWLGIKRANIKSWYLCRHSADEEKTLSFRKTCISTTLLCVRKDLFYVASLTRIMSQMMAPKFPPFRGKGRSFIKARFVQISLYLENHLTLVLRKMRATFAWNWAKCTPCFGGAWRSRSRSAVNEIINPVQFSCSEVLSFSVRSKLYGSAHWLEPIGFNS